MAELLLEQVEGAWPLQRHHTVDFRKMLSAAQEVALLLDVVVHRQVLLLLHRLPVQIRAEVEGLTEVVVLAVLEMQATTSDVLEPVEGSKECQRQQQHQIHLIVRQFLALLLLSH